MSKPRLTVAVRRGLRTMAGFIEAGIGGEEAFGEDAGDVEKALHWITYGLKSDLPPDAQDPDRVSAAIEREQVHQGEALCARCRHPRSMHGGNWRWDPPYPCEVTIGGECDCPDFEEEEEEKP